MDSPPADLYDDESSSESDDDYFDDFSYDRGQAWEKLQVLIASLERSAAPATVSTARGVPIRNDVSLSTLIGGTHDWTMRATPPQAGQIMSVRTGGAAPGAAVGYAPWDTVEVKGPKNLSSLPIDIILDILQLLPPQELACNGRLACKAAARRFSQPAECTVRLSIPMNPHVAQCWREGAQAGLAQLPFTRKMALLPTAAGSGCVANLEAAWALVEPDLAPELLPPDEPRRYAYMWRWYRSRGGGDAASAAAAAGHLHLLPWILEHGLPLDPKCVLAAAAPHGDLAALQHTLLLLHRHGCLNAKTASDRIFLELVHGVAEGGGPHAPAKLAWLQEHWPDKDEVVRLLKAAPHSACTAADPLPVLRWLLGQGIDLRKPHYVYGALFNCKREVLEWLMHDVGCPVPKLDQGAGGAGCWDAMDQEGTAGGQGGAADDGAIANLRWLRQQGVDLNSLWERSCYLCSGNMNPMPGAVGAQVSCLGEVQLGVVRYLHEECGVGCTWMDADTVVCSWSPEMVAWLCAHGGWLTRRAYGVAYWSGNLPALRWLLHEAHVPVGDLTVLDVLKYWGCDGPGYPGSRELLEAVRMLLEAGCPTGGDREAVQAAARKGDLSVLRYLHEERGMEVGPWALASAAEGGCEAVLEWLVAAGCGQGLGGDAYVAAGMNYNFGTLSRLLLLGVPMDKEVLVKAVGADRSCPLVMLKLLADWSGAVLDGRAVGQALEAAHNRKERQEEAIAWLKELWARVEK